MDDHKEIKSTSLRISRELAERLSRISRNLPGTSMNSLGVEFLEAMLILADTPEHERSVPKIIKMIDGAIRSEHLPEQKTLRYRMNDATGTLESEPPISTRLLKKAKETTK